MKWFEGNIPEAIGAAKMRNAVFVVYVHDSSDASKATDAALADDDISAQLSSVKYVAIQLEIGTEGATQFSQIYPLVLVPSLFFISGQTGMPLEVLGGPLTKENLKEKLTKLTSDKEASNEKQQKESPSNAEMPQEAASCEDGTVSPSTSGAEAVTVQAAEAVTVQGAESLDATPVQPSGSKDCANDIDGVESTDASVDEKVRRAKELLAEKQESQAQEKVESEKQKEIDRRKMGQEVARKKHEHEQKEMKDAAQERRKEKQEDKLARERVKAQIAADRAEREARAAILRGEQPTAPEPAAVPSASNAVAAAVPSNSNITRLKFRLTDGSSSIAQFPSDATLADVRRHIVENIPLDSHNFSLTATVHPRPFTPEDLSLTLNELGLVPSAILVILPMSSTGSGSVTPAGGGVMGLFWILLSPITFLLGLMRQFFGGGRGAHHPPSTSDEEPVAKRLKEDESNTTTQRPKTAYGKRGEARLRRDGNIHRLRNDADDDDNNTWNGNSTQQM